MASVSPLLFELRENNHETSKQMPKAGKLHDNDRSTEKAESRSIFNCCHKPFKKNDLQPVKALQHKAISAGNEQAAVLIQELSCHDMGYVRTKAFCRMLTVTTT